MRTLQIVPQPSASAAAGDGTRRVFVSYSHHDGPMAGDGDLPAAVVTALYALAEDRPELGLARSRIFFDREQLMAGDQWNDRIKSEIQRCDVFLLLMTLNSLTSAFCIKEELAEAVRQGVPVIVPVLLSTCPWSGHVIAEGPPSRRLGDLDAVPKDGNGNVVPIKSPLWPDRETALTRTVEQIARKLAREMGAAAPPEPEILAPGLAPPPAPAAPSAPGLPPFLPYLCNQDGAVGDFNAGVQVWDSAQAMLVLVKGGWDDDTEGFLGRLCAKNLHDFCELNKTLLLDPKPLVLPQAMDGAKVRKSLAVDVRGALSQALFDNLYRIRTSADVAEALQALPGVRPLFAMLPQQPDEGSVATLKALLDLLEDVPPRTPLDRLVIALQVASPQLVAETTLRKRFKLDRRRRVQVVELAALEPVDREDVRKWHHDVGLAGRVDQPQLLQQLFAQAEQLRLRPFDRSVRPLLGLAPNNR